MKENAIYEFEESDFSFSDNSDSTVAEKLLWSFEKDEETGNVVIVPMNEDKIIIHGKEEVEMFCSILTKCFQ